MTVADRQKLDKQNYRLVAAFPYRDVDYANPPSFWRPAHGLEQVEKDAGEQFELSVRTLFSKMAVDVMLDLRNYH